MSQIYPNIEAIYKVKDSRQMLLDRDNSIRTNFSGKNPPADVTTDDIGCSWFNTNDNLLYNLVSINPDGTNAVWQKNANFSSFNTMSLGKLTKELLFVDLEGDRCDAKQDLLVLVEHTILPSENYELTNDRKRVTFKTPIEAGLYVELRWFSKVIIGRDGKTFIPTISNKVLHWENDGQLPNPPDFDFGEAQKDVVVEGDNQEKRITNLSNQINSDIDKQKKSFDDNAIKQLTSFNNNVSAKTEIFNNNAVTETNKFNNNAAAETKKFNDNTVIKINNFNSNAQTLTTAYNANATQKENNLNKIFEEKQVIVNASVDKAKQSETNAKKAEEAANLSKNNAQESERKSRVWAEGTDQEVAELNGTKSSKGFMELAKISETNAKTSEGKAKTSETNAKTSEGKAKTSETNTKTSETNAKTSEGKAKTSETNAKASEDKAKISETNAQISETNAKASELKAEEYAALLSGVYKYRGTKPTYADLPKTKNEVGDVWDIQDTGKNFAWNGKEWDDLGGNLAGYATKEDLKSYQTNANLSQNLDTSTTKYPSNKAVKDAIDAKDSLPTQVGNNGKFLQTDGKNAKWSEVDLSSKADNNSVVHLTGNETIIGSKTISNPINLANWNMPRSIGIGNNVTYSDIFNARFGQAVFTQMRVGNKGKLGQISISADDSGNITTHCPSPRDNGGDTQIANIGWVNKKLESVGGNIDQNTKKSLYNWVGTTAEYETQKVAATHPDWVCYITDDTNNTNSANINLNNITEQGKLVIRDNSRTINQKDNSNIYDWVGTKAEFDNQKVAETHPDWVWYITDDLEETPDNYTKSEIDALLSAKLSKFTLGDYVVDYYPKTPQERNDANGSYWRLYKSGWLEQGGLTNITIEGSAFNIRLFKEFADTNYSVQYTKADVYSANNSVNSSITLKKLDSFDITVGLKCKGNWEAKGWSK